MAATLIIALLFMTCSNSSPETVENQSEELKQESDQPDSNVEDDTTTETPAAIEFQFKREQTFGSSDDVLLGVFYAVAVDSQNRVYMADRDQTKIHVFHPNGTFLTSLGREGRGPGEFFGIRKDTFIKTESGKLYVTDGDKRFAHRVHVFLLDDLTFSHTFIIAADNKKDFAKELNGYNATRVYPLKSGDFLIPYRRPEYAYRDEISYIRYMIQDSERTILDGPILEQQDQINLIYLVEDTEVPYNAIRTFPFFGKSLFAISGDDVIYTARSEEFKIDVRNIEGSVMRTIRYPFTKLEASRGELIDLYEEKERSVMGEGVEEAMIAQADSIPDTWPALNDLLVDDDNRLWVSTIVENFDIYEWWVLEASGELITKFEWPRNEPIEVIKNGYMYTRETDEETGLEQSVRYKIEI